MGSLGFKIETMKEALTRPLSRGVVWLSSGYVSMRPDIFIEWRRSAVAVFITLAMLLFAPVSHALPSGFQEQIILSGLDGPVHLKALPDGRMLLLQKAGQIFIFNPSVDPVQKTSYMKITDIEIGGERGLLTVALDPDFVSNNYLYIYYTHGSTNRNRISRFTHLGSTADLASEVVIWQDNEDWSDCCHYGGGLDFGPDGKLYLTTGEEFDGAQAQDLTRAGGKIIRINKDGTIPADNPFVDGPGGNLDEIWALGLRNPFRASWDLVGNRFLIGEVGGNVEATAREDLNIGRAGANYGWPYCEGQCTDPQYDDPVYDYGHVGVTPGGGSITAGFVYRGSQYPAEYNGAFFFGDYSRSFIKYLTFAADGSVAAVNDFSINAGFPVAFEMGADGAIYTADYAGQVRRYVYVGFVPDDPWAGLVLHLESDTGVSTTGTTVTNWIDQSASANDLTAFGNPQRLANSLNGLPVIEFDGVGDKLERSTAISGLPIGSADRTVYLVTKYNSSGFGGFAYGSTSCNQAFGLIVDSTGNLMVQGWCAENDLATTVAGNGAGWMVQSAVITNGQISHYVDGNLIDNRLHSFNTVLNKIVLGAELADSLYLNIQVAAVLIHNRALNSTEQQQMLAYLQEKYFGIVPGNQPPVANDDPGSVFRGNTLTLDVLANDTDADGTIDPTTVVISQQPVAGTLTVNPVTGSIQYTHDGGTVTADSFHYQFSDDGGTISNEATVSITIINKTNVSFTDVQSIFNARCIVCHGGTRDPDLRDGKSYLSTVGVPSSQAPAVNFIEPGSSANSYIWHKLNDTQASVGGFGVQMPASGSPLSASDLNLISAWVDVGAQSGNQPPLALDDSKTVATAASVNIAVLANDTDTDSWVIDPATVTIMLLPENGTVSDNGSGLLTYTHDGSATTSDRFTYTVADTLGAISNTAAVTLSVGSQPLLTTGLVLHLEADAGVLDSGGVVTSWQDQSGLGNDVVAAGDPLLLTSALNNHPAIDFDGVGDKLERTLVLNSLPSGNADRTVFLVANYRGTGFGGFAYGTANCNEVFGLIVSSTGELTAQGWCPVNDFITADTGTGAGWLIQSAVLNAGILTQYRDGTQIAAAAHNFNTVISNMVLGAELNSNTFIDMQVVTALIYNRALSAAERQQVDIYLREKYFPGSGGNQLPMAVDDRATASTSGSVDVTVLDNDTDADGSLDPATVMIILPPENGTVLGNGAGLLTYTHDGSANTSDRFTYTVADTLGGVSNTATVTLTITGVGNQPPLAADDGATLVVAGTVNIAVLANDVDTDGSIDASTVTILTPPANGTVSDNGAGLLTYTHNGSATTNDRFTYTVADTLGLVSNTATVSITLATQPLVSAGLVLQLDADTGVLNNAGVVTSWQDQSGMGNDVVSAGDPMLLTGALNGHPAIDFDGIDDKLERTVDLYNLPPGNTDRTVFLVANYRGTGFGGFAYGTANCNNVFGLVVSSTGELTAQGWCPANDFITTDVGTGTGWLTQSAVLNAGILTQYRDGTQIATAAHIFNTVISNMVLGAELNSNTFVDMQVVTALIYNRALSAAERQQVDTYLRDKYFPDNSFNQFPIATDDSATVATAGSIDIAVLSNDSDDGTLDPATVTIMLPPTNGTVLDNGAGLLTYTHDGSATTSDRFTYTVADTLGAVSMTATVTIKVTGVGNQPPVAVDDGATVMTTGSVNIAVLSNDVDADGSIDPATVSIIMPAANGTVLDNGTGLLTYTHDGSITSSDSFTYTVSDTLGVVSNTATVTLSVVAAGNQRPVATNDNASVVSAASVDIAVLSNDTDVDGLLDAATVTILTPPANGTVLNNGAGVLTYTHDGSAVTNDRFSYTVADTQGAASNAATVSVAVIGAGNQSPLAVADSATVTTAGSVDIVVQSNDIDADGSLDSSTLTILSQPANGSVVNNGSGVLTYQHDGSVTTSDSFTYRIADTQGTVSNAVTVSIAVIANTPDGDVAPLASPDGKLNAADMLIMTRIVLGQIEPVLWQIQHGDLYPPGSPDGVITLSDLILLKKLILQDSANDPLLVSVDDSATAVTASSVSISVLSNDSGTPDPATIAIVTQPLNGVLVDDGSGVLIYTHNGSATTSDSFSYTVTDVLGVVSDITTVTLTITAAGNQAPVATDDSATAVVSAMVDIAVLSNDADVDGAIDPATVVIVTPPANGTVLNNGSGLLSYTHDGSATSSDSFTYSVMDTSGRASNTATVSITVVGAGNQQPLTVDDDAMTVLASSVDIAVLSNDLDTDGSLDPASLTITTQPANGTLIDNGLGTLTYTHDGSPTASDNFSYTVADDQGAVSNIATVTIAVSGAINLSPLATDDSATVAIAGSVEIVVLSNDSDADGTIDPTTVLITRQPLVGVLIVDPVTGNIQYMHDGSAGTMDSFGYQVNDNAGLISNQATVSIFIGDATPFPEGEALYQSVCFACHGSDGGGRFVRKSIRGASADLISSMINALPPMNFLASLSSQEINDTADYLGYISGNDRERMTVTGDIVRGESLFRDSCTGCHALGTSPRFGPDLLGHINNCISGNIGAVSGEPGHDPGWGSCEWFEAYVTEPATMFGHFSPSEQAGFPFIMPDLNLSDEDALDITAFVGQQVSPLVPATPVTLTPTQFDDTRNLYFNHCAGCHGLYRGGATGPVIDEFRSQEIGTDGLAATIRYGTPGGMPDYGQAGIISEPEIARLAAYLQLPPPVAPPLDMPEIQASWNLIVPVASRPTVPQTARDWQNYFGVVLRDAGKVAIFDGDTHEEISRVDVGFAVHILRSSASGRYFYAIGRDGWVNLIDLWAAVPNVVAKVKGCHDARSVDGSKYPGYEDRHLIEGCYWPPQYVTYDGLTLEPQNLVALPMTDINGQILNENRVSAIVASEFAPVWVMNQKESGYVGIVDYSQAGAPIVTNIATSLFLHDGGWDHTRRYFLTAANASNQIVVVDVLNQVLESIIDVGNVPHPGRGANWQDPVYGWVNATPHIGSPFVTVYGADPVNNPEYAWKIVRQINLPAAGSLFIKTHPNSPWVLVDMTLSASNDKQICAIAKSTGAIDRCFDVATAGKAVHMEFNKDASEVWISDWAGEGGGQVILDGTTLDVIQKITLPATTGKFNVTNSANDIY